MLTQLFTTSIYFYISPNASFFEKKTGVILISATEENGVTPTSVQSEPSEKVTPRQTASVESPANGCGSTVDAAYDTETPGKRDAATGREFGEREVTETSCQRQTLDEGTLTENPMQMPQASVPIQVCKHDLSHCVYFRRVRFHYFICPSFIYFLCVRFLCVYILLYKLVLFHPFSLSPTFLLTPRISYIFIFYVPSDSCIPWFFLFTLPSSYIYATAENTRARTRAHECAHSNFHTHKYTHTHTHARTHPPTHTHTHTHTREEAAK